MHLLSRSGRLRRVAYPFANPELGTGNGSAIAREIIFTNAAETTTQRLQECVQDVLRANDSAAPNLLISSEDLCYADVEKFSRLKEVLLGHARSVKLLIAIRPLKTWTYSVYLQLVKAHALAADFDAEWLRAHSADFLFYFRNLDRFGVDTTTFRYQEKGLLRLFLAQVGEDPDLAAEIPDTVANRSLSVEELPVVRAVNGVFQDEALSRMISDELLKGRPERRGARFPMQCEPSFQDFAADFARRLDQFPGPVMSAVRAILFDTAAQPARGETGPGAPDPGLLPAGEVKVALRAIRKVFDARSASVAAHQRLLDYATGLPRTEACFDPIHYLLMHPDVLSAGSDPWEHYQQHGRQEGRKSAFEPPGSQ
jgi:hypothetical protein